MYNQAVDLLTYLFLFNQSNDCSTGEIGFRYLGHQHWTKSQVRSGVPNKSRYLNRQSFTECRKYQVKMKKKPLQKM